MMTPEDVGSILSMIRADRANIATTIPAIVVKYDSLLQTADVQLVVKRPYQGDDDPTDYPIRLLSVPVMFPQGSNWVVAGPLVKGDAVLIHCSMFDCEDWLIGNKETTYQAGSKMYHDINSSFATIGAFNYSSPTRDFKFKDKFHISQGVNHITMDKTEIVISCDNGASKITMNSGSITIDSTVDVTVNTETANINAVDVEVTATNVAVDATDVIVETVSSTVNATTAEVNASTSASITAPVINLIGQVNLDGSLDVTGDVDAVGITAATGSFGGSDYGTHTHTEFDANAGQQTSLPNNLIP